MKQLQLIYKWKININILYTYRFPDNLEVQTVWAQKCKRGNEWNPQSSSICSMHFKSECFDHDAELPGNYFFLCLILRFVHE